MKHTPAPWYVGAQNDMLYIIDRSPRPSNDDINPNADIETIARMDRAMGNPVPDWLEEML